MAVPREWRLLPFGPSDHGGEEETIKRSVGTLVTQTALLGGVIVTPAPARTATNCYGRSGNGLDLSSTTCAHDARPVEVGNITYYGGRWSGSARPTARTGVEGPAALCRSGHQWSSRVAPRQLVAAEALGAAIRPVARSVVDGETTDSKSTPYSTTDHRWLRIREAAGTTHWETSADGSTWKSFHHIANPFAVTALRVEVAAGNWAAEPSTSTARFDNINLPPAQVRTSVPAGRPAGQAGPRGTVCVPPALRATFIQPLTSTGYPNFPTVDWTQAQYEQNFALMTSVGIDTVCVQFTGRSPRWSAPAPIPWQTARGCCSPATGCCATFGRRTAAWWPSACPPPEGGLSRS
ncbi:hypothetical protein GCM10010278_81380 [Streptomyces melanogenes]|nr:hypothetical protein GCM10010278_81380 [Streptomyces melanogenes]